MKKRVTCFAFFLAITILTLFSCAKQNHYSINELSTENNNISYSPRSESKISEKTNPFENIQAIGLDKIQRNSKGTITYVGAEKVQYDSNGQITYIGNKKVQYDSNGIMTHIGNNTIHYDTDGKILQVGEVRVYY